MVEFAGRNPFEEQPMSAFGQSLNRKIGELDRLRLREMGAALNTVRALGLDRLGQSALREMDAAANTARNFLAEQDRLAAKLFVEDSLAAKLFVERNSLAVSMLRDLGSTADFVKSLDEQRKLTQGCAASLVPSQGPTLRKEAEKLWNNPQVFDADPPQTSQRQMWYGRRAGYHPKRIGFVDTDK